MWYYVIMTKTIKQMNKAELIAYASEVGREDVDEDMTKREIIATLEEDGLDDVEESTPVEPEKESIPASDEDKKIIKMIRRAAYYAYGPYVFSTDKPFVLMDSESAEKIIEANPEDFVIASTREVENFYK